MDFRLTEEQRLLSENIVRFAQAELNAGVRERDRLQEFPRDLWLKCGQVGLQGLPVPEEYGGAGCDPLSVAIALEAFGYGCRDGGLVFAVCAHLLACVVPVWKHGDDEQKRRWLPGLCDGTLIAVRRARTPSRWALERYAMAPAFDSMGPRPSAPTVPSPTSPSCMPSPTDRRAITVE
jgi:alkylation response protein AidB-like acyl-CoA dehydrogenase